MSYQPLRIIQEEPIPVNMIIKQYGQPPINITLGMLPGLRTWYDFPFSSVEYIYLSQPCTIATRDSFTENYKYFEPKYLSGEGVYYNGSLFEGANILNISPIYNIIGRVQNDKYIDINGIEQDSGYMHITPIGTPPGIPAYALGPIPIYNTKCGKFKRGFIRR